MFPVTQYRFPFTVTSTNLNLADTAEQTIHTFQDTNSPLVYVPRLLTLKREAGTPYTLGSVRRPSFQKSLAITNSVGVVEDDVSDKFLLFYFKGDDDNPRREKLVFRVNAEDLLANQTLSTAVNQIETKSASLPILDGTSFQPNEFTSLVMISNVSISAGTGNLLGEFWWEGIPV